MIYVFDDDANRLIYTGHVVRGQMMAIDTKDDDILVDGRRATEWDLDPDHRIQVYFDDAAARRRAARGRGRADDDVPPDDPRAEVRDTSEDPVNHRGGSWNP